jgi:uncharacterized membrane protein YphA (DoxX/SURF4 family)
MSHVIPFSPRIAHDHSHDRNPNPNRNQDHAGDTSRALPQTPLARVFFRFSFAYLLLTGCYWIFVFADKMTAFLGKPFNALWRPFTLWTAAHIFGWTGAIEPVFVRDTRYLYALLTCFLVFSALAAIVWTALDRKRKEYVALNHWLRVFVRYVLAYLLLHYGIDKVFLIQFPAPGLGRLVEPFGNYSPSSLMWAFIGASKLYTVFGGVAELLGAVLLLFRRTTTLGALIAFAVMFNVTIMDLSYDVGVKLLCFHILLMAMYLVLPDAGRLLNFFFLNRPTHAARLDPAPFAVSRRGLLVAFKLCVILLLIVPLTLREWKSYRQIGEGATKPPYYGLYDVDTFALNGAVLPPLTTDATRWRSIVFDTPNTVLLRHMDDSQTAYRMHFDTAQQSMTIDAPGEAADKSVLRISSPQNAIELRGTFAGAPVSITAHRVERSSFTLVNRGFHWISDASFIR